MNASSAPQHEVVVVGCGFAGIGMGIQLLARGFRSFVILEAAETVGGTWRDNVYPGVAVDIPSLTYSFSFEQKPDWSRLFAPGQELKRYADHCVAKYGLAPHIRCSAKVLRAAFVEDARHWELTLESGERLTCRYLISATGLLTQPKYPDIGLERFRGQVVHTARWPAQIELRGKRVAVIGTGATSVQLVPALADQVQHVSVFQRTPIWILPKLDAPMPRAVQALFRRSRGAQSLARACTTLGTEAVMVLAIVYQREFPWLVRAIEQTCSWHLKQQVRDPALRAALTPRYGFGCKRPSFSNDYLASFNRPNVTLEQHGIRELLPHAIVSGDGRTLPIDTLICATGFRTYEKGNLPTYEVRGRGGLELGAFWAEQRYQAYQGASVPGFPNFFLMVGPYAATGSSWFAMIENQAAHILRCLENARATRSHTVEVSERAHRAFFADIQRRQRSTVFFNNGCGGSNSYYFDQHGDAVFYKPASGLETYLRSRYFPLDHYNFESGAPTERAAQMSISGHFSNRVSQDSG